MKSDDTRRRRTSGALALALVLFVGGCSPADDAATTTSTDAPAASTTSEPPETAPPETTTTLQPRVQATMPTFDDDAELIEPDPAVTIGTLDNGITYYVRANNRPGGRAQLRLAVKAGSVQEEDDQHGVAHYLEHMLFNGTEKYPENDLIDVLQSFGSEFGPDINAYTSYEETVYQLNLPVDQEGLLETGLDVLREWAAAATIDPVEVDLERGVLLEEWRLRSQSHDGRYFAGVAEALLGGTPYEGQEPLADGPTLDQTTPESLRRFYDDWYRPDNLAVVVVGDVDVAATEQLIVDTFGELAPRQGPAPPVITTDVAPEPEFFVLPDPEFRDSFVELNYALPALEPGTVGSLRQQLALDVAWSVVATRLEEDVLRGVVPFHEASRAANPLVRTQRSPGVIAFADADELHETARVLLTEVERVLIHGFTDDEVGRIVDEFVAGAESALDRADTVQDRTYADAYADNFLGGDAIAAPATDARLRLRLLGEMDTAQVEATFQASVASTEPFVIVVGPEEAADDLPSDGELATMIEDIRRATIPPRDDVVLEISTLLDPPPRGRITGVYTFDGTNIEVGTFDNGARLILFPTDIVEGTVVFGATSLGGWSLVGAEDAVEAQLISRIVTRSGVGDFDQVSLDRFLSDKFVGVGSYISETTEGVQGSAATEDLLTLLQLVHLYMTEPRVTDAARTILIDDLRATAEDPGSDPQVALGVAIAELRFDDPRFAPVPSPEDLDTFDLDRALEIYEERFADAGDFVFVFAGDFDPGTLIDLALLYIASLPGGGSAELPENVRRERPPGIAARTVEAGSGEFGEVFMQWDVAVPLDEEIRIHARLLDLIIRQRLTERIREELSATYSPSSFVSAIQDPVESLEFGVAISADPTDLERIVAEVTADLADLRANGPTVQQMETAREQLVRELELFSNELLISILTFYGLRPDEDFEEVLQQIPFALEATRADIRDLARTIVDLDDYILVELVPESSEE